MGFVNPYKPISRKTTPEMGRFLIAFLVGFLYSLRVTLCTVFGPDQWLSSLTREWEAIRAFFIQYEIHCRNKEGDDSGV